MAGPETEKLIKVLDELVPLLRDLDHSHWSEWMAESARRLRRDDFSGVVHLLSAYGGMGSFNDILPCILGRSRHAETERAHSLRSEALDLAERIRRKVEAG